MLLSVQDAREYRGMPRSAATATHAFVF